MLTIVHPPVSPRYSVTNTIRHRSKEMLIPASSHNQRRVSGTAAGGRDPNATDIRLTAFLTTRCFSSSLTYISITVPRVFRLIAVMARNGVRTGNKISSRMRQLISHASGDYKARFPLPELTARVDG